MVATCVETMGSFDRYVYMEYGLGEAVMGVTKRHEKYEDLNIWPCFELWCTVYERGVGSMKI